MPSRFARPDTTDLPISNGDRLTVKRRLTHADSRRLRGMQAIPTMAEPGVVMAYLVDWTLRDDAGKPVPIDGASHDALAHAIDALDEDAFDEIYAVIAAHRDAMQAERAAEKNGQAGEKSSPAISPSPFAVAGPLMSSVR